MTSIDPAPRCYILCVVEKVLLRTVTECSNILLFLNVLENLTEREEHIVKCLDTKDAVRIVNWFY
jgi:hypothetical protein